MGYRPTTYCPECGDPHDVYTVGLCGACEEIAGMKNSDEIIADLIDALETIAGGYTNRFPGAPDVMAGTPEQFRQKMWTWSQAVARAAITKAREEA